MLRIMLRALAFVAVFLVLQAAWSGTSVGEAVSKWWIERLTVPAASALLNTLTPEVGATPRGPSIAAPGGGLNIWNGCDGADVAFLLLAALCVAPLSLRVRAVSSLAAVGFVFALNLVRILVLFYAYRSDRAWFDVLHTLYAPVALVLICAVFFQAVLRFDAKRRATVSHESA